MKTFRSDPPRLPRLLSRRRFVSRMRFGWGQAITTGALILACAKADDVQLSLEVNRESLFLGEAFVLAVRVDGIDDPALIPDLSALDDATRTPLGSQSRSEYQIRRVGGRTDEIHRRARVHLYRIEPVREGPFRAGPVRLLRQDGRTLTAEGPLLQVTGITEQPDVQLEVQVSTETVLLDESFDVTLEIRIAALPKPHDSILPWAAAEPPALSVPFLDPDPPRGLEAADIKPFLEAHLNTNARVHGFKINDFSLRQHPVLRPFAFDFDGLGRPAQAKFVFPSERVTHQDRPVWRYRITRTYTAKTEGMYDLGPATFKGTIFDGIVGPGNPRRRNIYAVGAARTVRVMPPPEEGRPAGFTGVVATDMTVSATLHPQVCEQGEPVQLSLDITGKFNVNALTLPRAFLPESATQHFRIHPESVESEPIPDGKRFHIRVRPLTAGTQEFPPLEFAYFCARRRMYRTVSTLPIPLQVRPATEWVLAPLTPEATALTETLAPAAIRPSGYIRYRPEATTPAIPPPAWWLGPVLALAWPLGRRIRQRVFGMRYGLRVRKSVTHLRQALDTAQSESPSDGSTEAVIRNEIRRYLSARWNIPHGQITAHDVPNGLIQQGVDPVLADQWGQWMARLDASGYGYSASIRLMSAEWKTLRQLLADTESKARRASTRHGRIGMVLLIMAGSSALHAGPEAPTDRIHFLARQAESILLSAEHPEDFGAAAEIYRKMVEDGQRDAILFYNKGLALLCAEEYEAAVHAFRRAERWGGQIPGLSHNVSLALQRASMGPDPSLVRITRRILLAPHYHFGIRARLRFLWFAWTGFWIGIVVNHGERRGSARRQWARRLSGLAVCGMLASGSSLAVSVIQEMREPNLPVPASKTETRDPSRP